MKGDQMGIRAASPTPLELPLSNWTWFSITTHNFRIKHWCSQHYFACFLAL